jgi:hypothetical protein
LGICFGVSELVVSIVVGPTSTCNNAPMMTPFTWLLISGLVTTIFALVNLKASILHWRRNEAFDAWMQISSTLGLFLVAWNVVGSYVLWRDNSDCSIDNMRRMMMASIITIYILMLLGLGVICSSGQERPRNQIRGGRSTFR